MQDVSLNMTVWDMIIRPQYCKVRTAGGQILSPEAFFSPWTLICQQVICLLVCVHESLYCISKQYWHVILGCLGCCSWQIMKLFPAAFGVYKICSEPCLALLLELLNWVRISLACILMEGFLFRDGLLFARFIHLERIYISCQQSYIRHLIQKCCESDGQTMLLISISAHHERTIIGFITKICIFSLGDDMTWT